MKNVVSRKLAYDNRVALQQADQAIKKSVLRALVELITNCNDSYQRLRENGVEVDPTIEIELLRRHRNSILRIRDRGEGLSADDMDQKIGTYGAETSGFSKGSSVRGFWGRGVKDSFFGLGHGEVHSIKDDKYCNCILATKKGEPRYERQNPTRATKAIRRQLGIATGSGTVMEITISRDDVRTPLFDKLRRELERHFELRTIMSGDDCKVVMKELNAHGVIKNELQLRYSMPTGEEILLEQIEIPEYGTNCQLRVFRSDVPLSSPEEAQEMADGGLLVSSKGVILELTLFKFSGNEFASKLFGTVRCDYFHELLMKDPPEPVIKATRDGVDWKHHKFARKLKKEIEDRLEPIVEEERKRVSAEERSITNRELRKKLTKTLRDLNSIANAELDNAGGSTGEGVGDKVPLVPASGFGFVPEYAHIQSGKSASLKLRTAIPEVLDDGATVQIRAEGAEVSVLTPTVIIRRMEGFPNIGEALVELEGRQVGSETIITAESNGYTAEALVKVVSKRIPPEPSEQKKKGGLFGEIKFDSSMEPKQRVYFEKATSIIKIATKAPSVAHYFDDEGNGLEGSQGQVMIAELITEAVCREIARRGVEKGKFLAMPGAESDATNREYIRLQNEYAHKIHASIVDDKYRKNSGEKPRRGRPSKREQLESAVDPA